MPPTRAVIAPPTRTSAASRTAGIASVIGLQRSAGNTSTMALLRRTHGPADDAPVTLTLPGVVEGAPVSSWSFDNDARGTGPTGLHITRPTDTNSPVLSKAASEGAEAVTARLVVRKLTPLGWVHQLTLIMEGCMVSSFQTGEHDESVGLTFTAMQVDQ